MTLALALTVTSKDIPLKLALQTGTLALGMTWTSAILALVRSSPSRTTISDLAS